MKRIKDYKIFIADEIHQKGISMLTNCGFKVIIKYNLDNKGLFDFINKYSINESSKNCLIIRSVRKIKKDDIDKLSSLHIRLLITASSGIDNIDVFNCKKAGIKALNIPYGNYISAAEHTVGMILNILKNISVADKDMKSGIYKSLKYINYELSGKTVGIIGVGKVGSHTARICKSFGANIIGNDIKKSLKYRYKWIIFKELNALLKASDIVTVHTPLDNTTLNLINKNRLRMMKKNAIIVNCARGGIIDEKELIRLLKSKKIYYAGLDVFKNEQVIDNEFIKLRNVILTPHLAGKTLESKERISVQIAQRIILYYSEM